MKFRSQKRRRHKMRTRGNIQQTRGSLSLSKRLLIMPNRFLRLFNTSMPSTTLFPTFILPIYLFPTTKKIFCNFFSFFSVFVNFFFLNFPVPRLTDYENTLLG